ncbi:MAG: phosphate ABC transporter substrate-binding protein [Tumebacillaceae bacterium]
MFGNVSKKMVTLGLVATVAAGVMAGCGKADNAQQGATGDTTKPAQSDDLSGKVTAAGSTALMPLVKAAAEEFQAQHENVEVSVSGGGSGTGLKQVAEGSIDIGNSDVPAGTEYASAGLVDHVVAIAPFLLITNKNVGIDNLTKEQAGKVLSGEVKNWKEVGGKDEAIKIVGRAEGSGSRKYIKSALIPEGKDFPKDAISQDSSGSLRTAVEQTPGAIGYVDAAYANQNVKVLKLDGVEYTQENVAAKKYTLFSEEHMFTKGEPNKQVKAFLNYMMSDDFQSKKVEEIKFMPVSKMKK